MTRENRKNVYYLLSNKFKDIHMEIGNGNISVNMNKRDCTCNFEMAMPNSQ